MHSIRCGRAATIARRVGPTRGIVSFLVLGAAIGGSIYLIRYLRARAAEQGEAGVRSSKGEHDEKRESERARWFHH